MKMTDARLDAMNWLLNKDEPLTILNCRDLLDYIEELHVQIDDANANINRLKNHIKQNLEDYTDLKNSRYTETVDSNSEITRLRNLCKTIKVLADQSGA
jgi:hypothetical protein